VIRTHLVGLFSAEITIDRRLWANMLETVAAQGFYGCIFFVSERQTKPQKFQVLSPIGTQCEPMGDNAGTVWKRVGTSYRKD
jgi:hypothetical protein